MCVHAFAPQSDACVGAYFPLERQTRQGLCQKVYVSSPSTRLSSSLLDHQDEYKGYGFIDQITFSAHKSEVLDTDCKVTLFGKENCAVRNLHAS